MKRLIVSLSIFALIGAVCIVEFIIVNKKTDFIISKIDNVKEVFVEDDVEKAMQEQSILSDQWECHQKLIELFASHTVLVDIDRSFAVMRECIENGDKDNFFVESVSAKALLKQLQDEVACNIHNIL